MAIESVEELVRVLKQPTGATLRHRIPNPTGTGKIYVEMPATRTVYKCQGGGWAVDYRGGDVATRVVEDAIASGRIVDAYAGKFPGAHAGVGYELAFGEREP